MTAELDRLVDEIVKKVQDQLLSKGLRLSEKDIARGIRPELADALAAKGTSAALPMTTENGPRPMPKTSGELAAMIDHTLLKPDATEADLRKLCEEARTHKFATVCVNSAYIPTAASLLKGSSVKPIAVVGFPLGAATMSAKAFEAREAVKNGAQEIDMVINVGELKSRHYAYVLEDIRAVVEASSPFPVKVILETALLENEQKAVACALSKAAGAAYVKTSTGFGPGGATAEDISLMRRVVGPDTGVKASGGIRTIDDARRMIEAGASRIGASASVAIVQAVGKSGGEPAGEAKAGGEAAGSKHRKPFSGLPYKANGAKGNKGNGGGGSSSGGSGPKGGGY